MSHTPRTRRVLLLATSVSVLVACVFVLLGLRHASYGPLASAMDSVEAKDLVVVEDSLVDEGGRAPRDDSGSTVQTEQTVDVQGEPSSPDDDTAQAHDLVESGDEEDGAPRFTIPEGTSYVSDTALVTVPTDADPSEVSEALSRISGIVAHEVTAEEVAAGVIEVGVAEGGSVEDAVTQIMEADVPVELGAQPDYVYYPAGWFSPGGLRARLAASFEETVALPQPLEELTADEDVQLDVADVAEAETDETGSDAGIVDEEALDGALEEPAASSDNAQDVEVPAEEAPSNEPSSDEAAVLLESDGAVADETGSQQEDDAADDAAHTDAEQEAERPAGEETASAEGEGTPEDLIALLDPVTVNDPEVASQWALADIGAYEAWSMAKCSGKVTVAVMDTGFDVNHVDLKANLLPGRNIYESNSDVSPFKGTSDYSHGTHSVGIISAVSNNGIGVSGVSYNAKVLPLKVFFKGSSGIMTTSSTLVKAYTYVKNSGYNVRVVNLSLGGVYSERLRQDTALQTAVNEAHAAGIVTVAAAGNSSLATPPFDEYPGDLDNVVSVINITSEHVRNNNSNYNRTDEDLKNISAPGTSIYSTIPSDSYSYMSGTSMASPYVAGVLALEFAADPSLTASQAVSILYGSATDLGDPGWDREYGWGEVNAANAVANITKVPAIANATITLSQKTYVYDGTAHEPSVTVSYKNKPLEQGKDYTVQYQNNVQVGTASVIVTGVGTYTGVKSAQFTIEGVPISLATVELSQTTFEYTGYAHRPSVTVTHGGKRLSYYNDYTLSYANNINAGTATVTVKGLGNYSGSVSKTFTVAPTSLASASVTLDASYPYTGRALTPVPTVRLGSWTLTQGTDFTTSYRDNVSVGMATATVTGRGNFVGTARAKFRVAFSDVERTNWAFGVIHRANDLGIVSGYGGANTGMFGPTDSVLRCQAVVMLWNAAGRPAAKGASTIFSDVEAGAYYEHALAWASSLGVVHGYGDGTLFGPYDLLTREQFAVMVANYAAKVKGIRVTGSTADFADMGDASQVSDYAARAMGWCFRKGILSGTGEGMILPQGNATRAHAAKMVLAARDLTA